MYPMHVVMHIMLSLQVGRAETMVDGLPRACRLVMKSFFGIKVRHRIQEVENLRKVSFFVFLIKASNFALSFLNFNLVSFLPW